ncbi:helix-turn-helix domain-containing protein [Frankia sp. AgB1.9]|uniref:helix-turn-helix transcriptional regulator n=1 Tax=unclassified Frankia TaxID=2632575 RepID=UPI0035A9860E|nr:helix-turn-helix domain-containing protein [Frankia sp. AgW1.1]MBL7546350.1 helix-turn-helix domain-containing protein [Frankia sp. AgB1.9]
MTPTELAEFLGVSTRQLQRWRLADQGPAYVQIGRSVRYQRLVVLDWVKRSTVKTRPVHL